MRAAGQPEEAIRSFASAYERLVGGESAMMPSAELEPAGDVDALEDLPEADGDALDAVAVIKLNGGLATTMGLRSPKSLVEARDGRSFLDIIIGNTLALRARYGVRLPLVLMNSQATRADTLRGARVPSRPRHRPAGPTSCRAWSRSSTPSHSLRSAGRPSRRSSGARPGMVTCTASLRSSGMLDALLERGFRYAMISNADNLGATPDARIAAHVERERDPVPDGGRRGNRGRSQGRTHRAPARGRAAGAARDRADSA